jgi:hypothetical protein
VDRRRAAATLKCAVGMTVVTRILGQVGMHSSQTSDLENLASRHYGPRAGARQEMLL